MGDLRDLGIHDEELEKKLEAMEFCDFEEVADMIKDHNKPKVSCEDNILDSFQANVTRLFVKPDNHIGRLVHAAVGVAGEGGELLDATKKTWIYNKPLDKENILEECGDALFYVQALLTECGFTMEQAMRHNLDKLNKRYPDGYTDKAARERADKVE